MHSKSAKQKTLLSRWPLVLIMLWGLYSSLRSVEDQQWMRVSGYLVLALGVGMNLLVIALNGGRMPVRCKEEVVDDPGYEQMHSKTRLRFLGDWIDCYYIWASPGDFLLLLSLIILVFLA